MRTKVIAGNWKMNYDLNESKNLISKLSLGLKSIDSKCEVVICPPFTSLSEAGVLIKDTKIKLGAQNIHEEENGAFTGEISAQKLLSTG